MGNFCENCGRELQEGEQCTCTEHETEYDNQLLGKVYSLRSSTGMYFAMVTYGVIRTTVTMAKDRLLIDMKPAKKNKVPAIMLSDITMVSITNYFAPVEIVWVILCLIFTCLGQFYCLLFAALFLWLGANKKITIYLRSGNKVELFSRDKDKAEELKNDLDNLNK